MTIMESLKALHKEWAKFKYGIPVDGEIQNGDAEWWDEHYHLLSPEEFVKYKGGVCWDFVEFGREFLIKQGVDPSIIHQIYIITDTPPNYDTHTFLVCDYDDGYLYVESSFKKVDEMIGGVKRFNTIEDICKLITETMFQFNGNDRFKSFKYDVMEFKDHPPYGSTCSEYMNWMNENGEMIHQGIATNPNHNHLMDEEVVEEYFRPKKPLYFHISTDPHLDEHELKPRIPSYLTNKKNQLNPDYPEEKDTKRICVSPSINGCLEAILNMEKILKVNNTSFYVYTPEKPFDEYKHKTNKELIDERLVFDANITKEAWILEPCKMKLYGVLRINKIRDKRNKDTINKGIKLGALDIDWEWVVDPKVFKEYAEDLPPKKISLTYDTLYFGSKNKIKGNIKLRNDQLFVTPFITLASIFAVAPRSDFKCPLGSYNLQYDEWKKPCEALMKETQPLKNVNISIEGCPDLIPYSMESSGYIYAIDASKVKDNIYQLDWMDRDREFIIKGIETVKVKEVIEVNATCNIRGEKSDSPKHHVSKFVPSDFTTENTFMKNKSVYLTPENLDAYKDKCKDFKTGLKSIHINENVRGQIWPDSKNNVSAYVACEKRDDKIFIVGLELAPNYQDKSLGKELLDFAVYVYGATHLSVDKKDTQSFDLYQRCGWKLYDETDKMYYMRRRDVKTPSDMNKSNESSIQESVLSAKERDELKDSEFGIPELRQYPLNDEVHVKQAVKMFSHAPKKYRNELAKRIIAKANKFGIDHSGWDEIHKYNVLNYIRESSNIDNEQGDAMMTEHSILMSNEEFFTEYHDDKKKVIKDLKEKEENFEIKKQRDIIKKIIQKGPYGEYDNAKKKFVLNTNKILKGMSANGYSDDDKRIVYKYLMKLATDLKNLRDTNQLGKFNKAKHDILRMVGKVTDEERVLFDIKFIDPYNSKYNSYALSRKIYGVDKCAIIGFSSVENQVFKPFPKTRYFHSMDKPMTGTSLNPSHKAKDGPVYPSDRVYFIAYNCTNSEPTELDLDPGFRVSHYYEYIPKKDDVFYIDKEYHNYDSTRKMVFINTKKSLPVKDVTNEILENSSKRRVSESYTYDPEDYEDSEINENNKDEIFNEESYTERNLFMNDDELFMEVNKNLEKSLKILDYDPNTKTIKSDITLPNGDKIDRLKLLIDPTMLMKYTPDLSLKGLSAFVMSSETLNKEYDKILEKIIRKHLPKEQERKELDLLKAEKSQNVPYGKIKYAIVTSRRVLKMRNNAGVATVGHEMGHIYFRSSDGSDTLISNTMENINKFIDDNVKPNMSKSSPNYFHATYDEEYGADNFSSNKYSKFAMDKSLEKMDATKHHSNINLQHYIDDRRKELRSCQAELDLINPDNPRYDILIDKISNLEKSIDDAKSRMNDFSKEMKYRSQYINHQSNKNIGESYTERNGVVMNTLMKKQAHIMESYKMGIIHEKEALQLIERVMIENGDDVETSPSSGDTSALADYINSLDETSKQQLLDSIKSGGDDYENRETSEESEDDDEDDEGSTDDESAETDESSEEEEKHEDEDDEVEDDTDFSDTNLEDMDI